MDVDKLDEGLAVITYDVPAPDQWRTHYRIIYNLEPTDKERELLLESFKMRLCPKCEEYLPYGEDLSEGCPLCDAKISEKDIEVRKTHLRNFFGEKYKQYNKLPPAQKQLLYGLLYKDIGKNVKELEENIESGDFRFELYINKEEITDPIEIFNIFNYLREEGLSPIPEKPKKSDFWRELTKHQKKHNKLIEEKGSDTELLKYRSVKKEKFTADGELIRIEWDESQAIFTENEVIDNPKYLEAVRKGVSAEELENIDEVVSVKKAFEKARNNTNSRYQSNGYKSISSSVYIVPLDKAFIPNTEIEKEYTDPLTQKKIKVKVAEYDDDKSKVRYVYSRQDGFKIAPNVNKNNHQRYPDDPNATNFEEIFMYEYLPLFKLLSEFMIDFSKGEIKKRYLRWYNKIIGDSIEGWVILLDLKPVSENSKKNVAIQWATQQYYTNKSFYDGLEDEVEEAVEKYKDLKSPTKHLYNFITDRERIYVDTIDNSNPLASISSKETKQKWVKRYNLYVKAYNKKKKLKKGDKGFAKEIDLSNLVQAEQICALMLQKRKWFYTIPNADFFFDDGWMEKPTWTKQRIKIEQGLFNLREQYMGLLKKVKFIISPYFKLPEITKLAVIRKGKEPFFAQAKKGNVDTLIEYYEDIAIYGEEKYRSPTKYLNEIEEWVKENKINVKLGDRKKIKERAEKSKKSSEIKKEEEYEELEEIVSELIPLTKLKKSLDEKDIENI